MSNNLIPQSQRPCLDRILLYLIEILAHLVAMEGHLLCLKFIVSANRDISSILGARNDQGDTPKSLAEQFFKEECCTYLDALEWEQDHPEQAESKDEKLLLIKIEFSIVRSRLSCTCCCI